MPTLVNYSGDDEFYSGSSICTTPMDLGCLYSMVDIYCPDIYCPPRKRARITAPFLFREEEFEQKQLQSIEVLPDECLFEILRRIPGGKERSSCACVSKKWLMLLSSVRKTEICKSQSSEESDNVEIVYRKEDGDNDGHLTRCLEGKKATDIRLAAIAVGTSSRGGLGKLSIRGSNSVCGVTDLGFSAIAHGCPSLKTLSLWNVSSIGDEALIKIARECKLVEKLDLSQCPSISNRGLIAVAENCPNLTALNIESCARIGNEGLQAVAKFCPKLQSISIRDCPLVGDHGVSSLLSSASVLSKVKLQGLNITDFSLAVLGHYGKNVTNLILTGLQNVSEKGFWVMGNAKALQKLMSLTIASCRGITDVSLEAIAKGCTNLKQIYLRKCWFVSDNGLVAFVKAVGSLESLQLEECNRVTQTGIIYTLSNCGAKLKSLTLVKCMGIKETDMEIMMQSPCRTLRSLSVRNCPGFGSASLAMVGKLCPQLQNIDLTGLYGITDAGLLPLVKNCGGGLVKVNLSGCLNLTDEAVLALSRLHGASLETLSLDGCRRITDSSLVAIAKNCLFLSDLDLSGCAITDSGIAVLACSKHLNLQILALAGCSEVSNKSMHYLKKLGNSLLGLNIQHCNSISSSTVELLVEYLWRCDILS